MKPVADPELPVRARAPRVIRGVARHFMQLGAAVVTEMPLANGRRADLVALDGKGRISIIEVKSGFADLAADHKWHEYLAFADRFYFAVDVDFPQARLPEDTGLIVADDFAAEIVRHARVETLSTARRKAMTLRFAHLAAQRLQGLLDPGASLA